MRHKKKRNNIIENEEGATAVEFALVAPVLLLIMMGIIDVGMMMFAQGLLENSAFTAARTGKTGYTEQNKTREETMIETLHSRAGILLDTAEIVITSVSYSEFDDIGESEPFIDANGNGSRDNGENYTDVNGNGNYDEDIGTSGQGAASEVVVYTVSYPWRLYTPMMKPLLGENGIVNLSSRIVVQNEPYN